jgi:site-specific recombinase XerD
MRIENNKTIRIAKQKLMYLNYAPSTISTYVHYMQVFLSNQQKQPIHLSAADFTDYLARFKFSSRSQQNQVISALKFLYTYVLHRKYGKVNFARPRKVRQLPKVIAHDTLVSAFSRIKNVKHMAILSLGYACALRVSENEMHRPFAYDDSHREQQRQ